MNIEEERKVFIETLKPTLIEYFGCGAFAEGFDKDTFDAPGVQFFFEGWLAAKAHAEEMAKPVGRVKESISTGWWVYYDVYQYGGLESKNAAEKWLIDRGYRVVEE